MVFVRSVVDVIAPRFISAIVDHLKPKLIKGITEKNALALFSVLPKRGYFCRILSHSMACCYLPLVETAVPQHSAFAECRYMPVVSPAPEQFLMPVQERLILRLYTPLTI